MTLRIVREVRTEDGGHTGHIYVDGDKSKCWGFRERLGGPKAGLYSYDSVLLHGIEPFVLGAEHKRASLGTNYRKVSIVDDYKDTAAAAKIAQAASVLFGVWGFFLSIGGGWLIAWLLGWP